MPATVQAIPIPSQKQKNMTARNAHSQVHVTRTRGQSVSQAAAAAASAAVSSKHTNLHHRSMPSTSAPKSTAILSTFPSSIPSPSSSPSKSKLVYPTASSSSSSATTLLGKTSTAKTASRDINVRDFFPEGDPALLKFVDEASIIRAQKEALVALNDAAFARALRESQETAAKEERKRNSVNGKGKEKEIVDLKGIEINKEEKKLQIGEPTSSFTRDGSMISSTERASPPVPVADTVTTQVDVRHQLSRSPPPAPSNPSPSSLPLQEKKPSSSPMTVPPPATPVIVERYSHDEPAAKIWTASLQSASSQNGDMRKVPSPSSPPVSASSSTSSSSSSGFSSPSSGFSTPTSATSMSSSASASAAARRTAASPTRAVPMTIPAEAFYSRSGHHKRGSSSTSSTSSTVSSVSPSRPSTATSPPASLSSSKNSLPPAPYIIPTSPPSKEKSTSSRSGTMSYTSAAAQAQAHAQAQAQAQQIRSSPTTSSTSGRAQGTSRPTAEQVLRKMSVSSPPLPSSPERPRSVPSPVVITPLTIPDKKSTSSRPLVVNRTHTPTPTLIPTPVTVIKSKSSSTTSPSSSAVSSTSTNIGTSVNTTNATSSSSAHSVTVAKHTAGAKVVNSTTITTSASTSASEKSRASAPASVTSSPGISPSTSITSFSASSSASASVLFGTSTGTITPVITTSASKVAAEKERERERERDKEKSRAIAAAAAAKLALSFSGSANSHTSSASAAAAAASKRAGSGRVTTTVTTTTVTTSASASVQAPTSTDHSRTPSISTSIANLSSSSSSLPSPLLRSTIGLDLVAVGAGQKALTTSNPPSPPRHAEDLFSVPPGASTPVNNSSTNGVGGGVVPVSSLSESDDEDEGEDGDHHQHHHEKEEQEVTVDSRKDESGERPDANMDTNVNVTGGVSRVEVDDEKDDERMGGSKCADQGMMGEERREEEGGEDEEEEVSEQEDAEEEEEEEEEEEDKKEGEGEGTTDSFFDELYHITNNPANRTCSKCNKSILSSDNSNSNFPSGYSPLHVSCSRCSTLFCRGCLSPADNCPKDCTGFFRGSNTNNSCCGIVNDSCCAQIRAIAMLEALGAFDEAYLAEVGNSSTLSTSSSNGNKEREEFIRDLISKPVGPQTKKLEGVLVKSMGVLVNVFAPYSSSPSPSSFKRKPGSASSLSKKKKKQNKKLLISTFASHFERSLMPEIIHLYLSNTNVKDWITHSEMYTAILDLLRYMFEEGFGEGVIDVELRKIEKSCGLKEWLSLSSVRGREEDEMRIGWVLKKKVEDGKERTRKGDMASGLLKGGAEESVRGHGDDLINGASSSPSPSSVAAEKKESEVVEAVEERVDGVKMKTEAVAVTMEPLKGLIMGLETHRTSLLEVLDKVTFMPTVVKLNMLCDGISQLVLGQVLGI